MDINIGKIEQKNKIFKIYKLKILFIIFFVFMFLCFFVSSPHNNKDVIIHVSYGQSINSITQDLENKNSIRNGSVLKLFIKLFKSGNGVVSGDYLIEKNSPVYMVAWQLCYGHHNIEPIKVTIREGLNNSQISSILSNKLFNFNKDLFLNEVQDKQGYLFPDTYFFFPLDSTEEIIIKLSDNFNHRTRDIHDSIKKSGRSLSEIIVMASILEGEANGKEDVRLISGILWKRISLQMPLQVDIDKSTYVTKGLPLKPLNNPGLLSIKAAIDPIDSSYLYYLHDKNGIVHFAKTYDEHKSNINKYLK